VDRITGKKEIYERYLVEDEKEFENILKNNYKKVFWEGWPEVEVLYFDIKKRIKSKEKNICVPDGVLLWLGKTIKASEIYVIEYELSGHTHEHIFNQLRKFKNALDNAESRKSIIDSITEELGSNKKYQKIWQSQIGKLSFYKGCSDLLESFPGTIVVVDEYNDKMKALVKDIKDFNFIEELSVLEARIYACINLKSRKVLKKDTEVMALYPNGRNDWFRATLATNSDNKKIKVNWADGDKSNTIVTNISPIKDLLFKVEWME